MTARRRNRSIRSPWLAIAAAAALVVAAPAQRWEETQGRSKSGIVARQQSLLDAGTDTLALLVASHPDDRYVLPAVLLRYRYGVRVAVLLASRGGGGQNSVGPETGDALERIRTLESEAGCSHFDGEVWYLNRPDRGYRRTAEETFGEWGRDDTLRELVRLVRRIRPDVVVTTHHAEETHGHDQALVELLPEALAKAADPDFAVPGEPHRVHRLALGAPSMPPLGALRFPVDVLEPVRGATFRRLAYDVLANAHRSTGMPGPMDTVFEPELSLVLTPFGGTAAAAANANATPGANGNGGAPRFPRGGVRPTDDAERLLGGLPSLFADDVWPGEPSERDALAATLRDGLLPLAADRPRLLREAAAALTTLRALRCPPGGEAERRRARRVEAVERIVRHAAGLRIEVETADPAAVAIAGEELALDVTAHAGGPVPLDALRAEAADGTEVLLEPLGADTATAAAGESLRLAATVRVPIEPSHGDPMAHRFAADRFEPPVRLRFTAAIAGVEIPVSLAVPIEQRAPVEIAVVPRTLLLPTARRELRFSVLLTRNTRFPVTDDLEVRAPAGYVVGASTRRVTLADVDDETFEFTVKAPDGHEAGVDVLRVGYGTAKAQLPVHKVDVHVPQALRLGFVLGRDDTLPSIAGTGGFGLRWFELGDRDLALRDLDEFDTIVVDFRALRERPAARRSFRRLLDFCARPGRRLVVLYHKDTEFAPAGEAFRGAPFEPFVVGRARVTRPDAPVTTLLPDHVLLTHPNRIRPGDWDGWEQERGLYFPSRWADSYEALLELHDPGQPLERGALLYARTGEGEYVYCALALWRQLKKLHRGGVRLLANLLTPQPARGEAK